MFQRQQRHPHHRRHRVDNRRDHRRYRAETEQQQHRHQVGKDRHGLHQVENRHQHHAKPVRTMPENTEQHAAADADRHRDDDRAERHHRAVPLPEHHQVTETATDQQRQFPVARIVPEQHDSGDERHP